MTKEEIISFRNSLLEESIIRSEVTNDLSYASFIQVFTEYLADAGILTDFTYAHYKRPFKPGRKNARVDGYSENLFEESISLVISDYSGTKELGIITKTEALQIFKECIAFVEASFEGALRKEIDKSDPAYDLAALLYRNRDRIRKLKFFLISDKIRSERAKNIVHDNIGDISIELHVWTSDRLYDVLREEGETREIDFKDYGGFAVKCICIDSNSYLSYMCAMPGELLANLYEHLGTELLEGNIRSFLSTKVAVNSGIRKTIINEPSKFFVYNNGISATATKAYIQEMEGQMYLTGIVDFQIVNGGQTTASLYNSRYKDKADLSTIYVPMKLTIVEKEESKAVIPLIAEYANTQNKVNAADFFSNHDFCIRMERYSRTSRVAPKNGAQYETFWFFERAKGQYIQAQMGKTPAQIKEFRLRYPKTQLFTKTDLAKYRNSWACMPDVVSKGAQTNFQKFSENIKKNYDDKANEYNEKYYKETVAIGILFRQTENLVSVQEWYQQGYRAQIVTYAIALFSYLLKKQYAGFSLDFLRIWREQTIPQEIISEMTHITKLVNESINAPDRETINVTQWCKRAECWKRVQESCEYTISNSILNCCIRHDEELAEKASARKDSKIDAGIEAEKEVFEYGAENWRRLYFFCLPKKLFSQQQLQAIEKATQIPLRLPTSAQAKCLLELLEIAMDNGYKK